MCVQRGLFPPALCRAQPSAPLQGTHGGHPAWQHQHRPSTGSLCPQPKAGGSQIPGTSSGVTPLIPVTPGVGLNTCTEGAAAYLAWQELERLFRGSNGLELLGAKKLRSGKLWNWWWKGRNCLKAADQDIRLMAVLARLQSWPSWKGSRCHLIHDEMLLSALLWLCQSSHFSLEVLNPVPITAPVGHVLGRRQICLLSPNSTFYHRAEQCSIFQPPHSTGGL